jgi:hypothetical protein
VTIGWRDHDWDQVSIAVIGGPEHHGTVAGVKHRVLLGLDLWPEDKDPVQALEPALLGL